MKIQVAVVGKPRDAALAAAISEYETRAARYWPLEIVEVKEESARSLSAGSVMQKEAEKLLARVSPTATLVLCDPGGQEMDSERFAVFLQEKREEARDLAFAIGGAHGIGDAVRARAHIRLALAPWTLPHEMARLVLAEQLYRAGTIRRGEPYHK